MEDLSEVEHQLVGNLIAGREFSGRTGPEGADCEIRAAVLSGAIIRAVSTQTARREIRVVGAAISGRFDLAFCDLGRTGLTLVSCQLKGTLDLTGAVLGAMTFESCELTEMVLAEASVATSISIRFTKMDSLDLAGLRADGTVAITDSVLFAATGVGLRADRLRAGGLFLDRSQLRGPVRLVGARLAGPLSMRETTLGGDPVALVAEDCAVGGPFFYQLADRPAGEVDLAYTEIGGPLVDSLRTWPEQLYLQGFTYRTLEGDRQDAAARAEWVSRSRPYSPDPYSTLAAAYRRCGRERDARRVAIRRERDRRRLGSLGSAHAAWNVFLGALVGYGYRPWRVLLPLASIAVAGSLLFSLPAMQTAMIPTVSSGPPDALADCTTYPCFSGTAYTLDTLLPVVDLHQDSAWTPSRHRPWGTTLLVVSWLLAGLGWVFSTAVVAGIGAVWRRE